MALAVREDLASEGQLGQEDHCRVCHRLGDMVICEHCNGPFHGTCLEPPLYEIPEEDWICPVCADHMVDGVFDAQVSQPGDARHNVLGVDRRGAKYWFLARRVWVEEVRIEIIFINFIIYIFQIFLAGRDLWILQQQGAAGRTPGVPGFQPV